MANLFPPPAPALELPSFSRLLVKGSFHATAPLHFCLTHVLERDDAKAVLLAPSRADFIARVKQFNDGWVKEHGGDGRTVNAARRIDMLYPPTPGHLTLLLSLFHEALFGNENDFVHEKTTFATTPSLLVLCEPSSFFGEDDEATVSSYMALLLHAILTISSLSAQFGKQIMLAVFDSGLDNLRMPLLRAPSPDPDASEGIEPAVTDTRESVASLAERYFEWVGTAEEDGSSLPTSQPQELTLSTTSRNRMIIFRRAGYGINGIPVGHEIRWQWREDLTANGVVFCW